MRIYLHLTNSKTIIPFNYQPFLTGTIHKWIGSENELHDEISLYSFSWLQNVDAKKDGIKLREDSYFFIGAHEETLIKKIVNGIMDDASVCFGTKVKQIQIVPTPTFNQTANFFTASPVFIKRKYNNRERHILYHETEASACLTETLQSKLRSAGLPEEGLKVSFDTDYPNPQTKVITYKNIGNKTNICPVIIEGSPEQIAFAWNVGIGNSTGIGFGALK